MNSQTNPQPQAVPNFPPRGCTTIDTSGILDHNNSMPRRLMPLVTGQVYHIFNRGIDRQATFRDIREHKRAMAVIDYYRFLDTPIRFSKLLLIPYDIRNDILASMKVKGLKHVEILSFCLMPNHFHFLLRQTEDNGISRFLSNFQNSYTRYFNTKNERDGALFLSQFKAVLIETDEQLIHVSRYIHLNPTTAYVVKDFDSLLDYKWSSLSEYLDNKPEICDIETVMGIFGDSKNYENFLRNQVEYQRELDKIKHLVLE